MTTPERRYLDPLAESYLEQHWDESWSGWRNTHAFDAAVADLSAEFEAAVTDRWVEWRHERRERAHGVLHNRGAVSRDGAGDSGVGRRGPDPQQDVGERRVGELARVKEKRGA